MTNFSKAIIKFGDLWHVIGEGNAVGQEVKRNQYPNNIQHTIIIILIFLADFKENLKNENLQHDPKYNIE
jgi:hypothetical protein